MLFEITIFFNIRVKKPEEEYISLGQLQAILTQAISDLRPITPEKVFDLSTDEAGKSINVYNFIEIDLFLCFPI